MAQISAKEVKELRDATNVGMMECKKALVEADGDKDKAIRILRERGVAIAAKKSARVANQGIIASAVSPDADTGALIEVNCETDFVARNEGFKAFVADLAKRALEVEDDQLADAVKDEVTAKVAEIGENIVVRRNVRFVSKQPGLVAAYIHLGSKVGVLLEMGCGKAETVAKPEFTNLAKDITLQIAAASPHFLKREDVPADVVTGEREVYAKQVAGKPENIVEKIVDGKLNKFYAETCLVEQTFIKDAAETVHGLIEKTAGTLGDTVEIRRYCRWQLGE